jgi:hypothetical protein
MHNHTYGGCLTSEDVRMFIFDRTIGDNDLLMDLNFSEVEIQNAMVRAAREYASIPPYTSTVNPGCLPSHTNMFLDATAAQLYISEMSKLMRNDIDYNSGNVTTNLVAKRIAHLKELYKLHTERFTEAAKSWKLTENINNGFFNY